MIASNRRTRQTAFTLVELLVVIGIIAILVGVLLPSLVSARRQAQTVKCSAALGEIANCFKLYSIDNKGYYPPMRCTVPYDVMFNSSPPVTYTGAQTYWMYFLARYVSHAKFGSTNTGTAPTAQDLANAMGSVLWGCPNFEPVQTTIAGEGPIGGIATVYTGYGMNGFPEYTSAYPKVSGDKYDALGDGLTPALDSKAVSSVGYNGSFTWANFNLGRWYKYSAYTHPADKALVGDCRAYVLEALKGSQPNVVPWANQLDMLAIGGYGTNNGAFWSTNTGNTDPNQTSYDFYRHGKYPGRFNGTTFNVTGGKIGYNVMFADGHVVTLQTREEGFLAARMRFPG